MKFFFDNNLSEHLANGLKAFGEDITHLRDLYNEDVEDVIWLKYIGEKRLVLITRDEKIRWNPAELTAIRKYKVRAFFLGGKNLNKCKIIQQTVRNWPRIKELSLKTKPPFAYRIPPSGTKFSKIDL